MGVLDEFVKIRKKYYFINYENDVKLAKRILHFLKKEFDKGVLIITFADIIYALRWDLGVFTKNTYKLTFDKEVESLKKRRPRLSVEAKLHSIKKALSILENSKLVKIGEINSDELNTQIKVKFVESENLFEINIAKSDFMPIKGSKQKLTDKMLEYYFKEIALNYDEITKEKYTNEYSEVINEIITSIEKVWIESYSKISHRKCYLTKYPTSLGESENFFYNHIFHESSMEYDIEFLSEDYIEDRTVCVYGLSSKKTAIRKTSDSFMRSAEMRNWSDSNTDRGHYLGHAIGGSIYANIFPQKREINRGIGHRGQLYRSMERYLEKNQGLFCFSRPIYFDFSNRPFLIEFGYLDKDFKWTIELFENI